MIKSLLLKLIRKTGYDLIKFDPNKGEFPSDFLEEHISIYKMVAPFTMTTMERIFAVIEAAKYVLENKIEGSVVECGVWRGGSMMAIAKTLLNNTSVDKELYLFDTYEGMPEPGKVDISHLGQPAFDNYLATKLPDKDSSTWCYASLEDVQNNMYSTGYPKEKIHFIKGKVESTIPENAPDKISLLRLDTDWYESTKHELNHLYPRLVKGGALIIDDYGHWQGARRAVDEYFKEFNWKIFLNRIDYTGRLAIKN